MNVIYCALIIDNFFYTFFFIILSLKLSLQKVVSMAIAYSNIMLECHVNEMEIEKYNLKILNTEREK